MREKLAVGVLASGSGSNFEALARACAEPRFPARSFSRSDRSSMRWIGSPLDRFGSDE